MAANFIEPYVYIHTYIYIFIYIYAKTDKNLWGGGGKVRGAGEAREVEHPKTPKTLNKQFDQLFVQIVFVEKHKNNW